LSHTITQSKAGTKRPLAGPVVDSAGWDSYLGVRPLWTLTSPDGAAKENEEEKPEVRAGFLSM
jgi:hypothetical protein